MLKLYRISERFYEALRTRKYGELIPYATLTAIAETDARETSIRSALLRAGRRLLRDDQKLLVCRPNIGYEIAKPEDYLPQARRYQAMGTRRNRRALEITINVPLGELTAAQQAAILSEQTKIQLKLVIAKHLDKQRQLPEANAARLGKLETEVPVALKKLIDG